MVQCLVIFHIFYCLIVSVFNAQFDTTAIASAVINGDTNATAALIVKAVTKGDNNTVVLATANAIAAGNLSVVAEAMTFTVAEKQADARFLADALIVVLGGNENVEIYANSLKIALTDNDPSAFASSITETINMRAIQISEANSISFLALEQACADAFTRSFVRSSQTVDAEILITIIAQAVEHAADFISVEGQGIAAGDALAISKAIATAVVGTFDITTIQVFKNCSLETITRAVAVAESFVTGTSIEEANVQAILEAISVDGFAAKDYLAFAIAYITADAYAFAVAQVLAEVDDSCFVSVTDSTPSNDQYSQSDSTQSDSQYSQLDQFTSQILYSRPVTSGGWISNPIPLRNGWSSKPIPLRIGFSVGGASGVENFRRSIEENFLPSPLDITYEGIFDEYYFDTQSVFYNDSIECEQLFCPEYSLAISKDPLQENPPEFDFYITVGLESGLLVRNFSRKPLNIVIVLDISGSMRERFILETDNDPQKIRYQFDSKLDIAKMAVIDMLQQLNNNDSLSIITFSDFAETLIKLTPFEEFNLKDIYNKIDLLEESGGTNMEAGYKMASKILKQCSQCMFNEKYENRIILLTDAQPNLGDTTSIGLSSQVKQNSGNSIFTTFVGVGLDFNTELSEVLTKTRGANYFVVSSPEEFRKTLSEEFDYMVTPLVFDLKLEIDAQSFNNGNGWKVIKVYGSPNLDGGLDQEGVFVEINTLFPSPKTDQGTKGGVVLLKMQKPKNSQIPLMLKVSYKDRTTLEIFESFSEVKIPDERFEREYFESTGAQKAVLLARYVDLIRGWIIDQHFISKNQKQNSPPIFKTAEAQLNNFLISFTYKQQQIEQLQLGKSAIVPVDLCEYYPADRIVIKENNQCQVQSFVQPEQQILPVFNSIFLENNNTDWEKVQLELNVSKQQGEAMEQFLIYLQDTIDEIENETLEQEVGILIKLIEISGYI